MFLRTELFKALLPGPAEPVEYKFPICTGPGLAELPRGIPEPVGSCHLAGTAVPNRARRDRAQNSCLHFLADPDDTVQVSYGFALGEGNFFYDKIKIFKNRPKAQGRARVAIWK